jgi:site-specific DNA recombinase
MFTTTERSERTDRPKAEPDQREWAAYLRLSKMEALDVRGVPKEERLRLTLEKLAGHEEEIREWADARGITIDQVYVDPGLSASKRDVVRPGWDAMMAAAATGRLAGIVQIAIDRFTRDPREIEDLIDLADKKRVSIAGCRNGLFDLNTASGRAEARGAATAAARESDVMGERIRATLARKMRGGKPMGGGRAFGFEIGGEVQRPAEVAILRDVARRFVAGEPLAHLARELNERGVKNARGNTWTLSTLGRLLGYARYGGYVTHKGEIVAEIKGEPVFDADLYAAVQALLNSRRRGRRPTGRFPLTGLLVCGRCGHSMNGATRTKARADGSYPREYRCPPNLGGCALSIDAKHTERIVNVKMVEVLGKPEHVAQIVAENVELTDARIAAHGELAVIVDKLRTLEVRWARGETDDAGYDDAKRYLIGRRKEIQATLDGLAPGIAITGYDSSTEWERLTDEERRTLIRAFHVRIVIAPHQRRVARFDASRVTFPDLDAAVVVEA